MSVSKRQKEGDGSPRHVRLYLWVMDTAAWQDLRPVARCAYIVLASKYAGPGSNNGQIPCSLDQLKAALHVGKTTAQAALVELQEHGFIRLAKAGSFNMKYQHASEWLLTEFKDDRPGAKLAVPTKEFARWQKSKAGSQIGPASVPDRTRSGPNQDQSFSVTKPHGSQIGPAEQKHGSQIGPRIVYQGEGGAAGAVAAVNASIPSEAVVPDSEPAGAVAPHNASKPAGGSPAPTPSSSLMNSPIMRAAAAGRGQQRHG